MCRGVEKASLVAPHPRFKPATLAERQNHAVALIRNDHVPESALLPRNWDLFMARPLSSWSQLFRVFLATSALGLFGSAPAEPPTLPILNQKVAEFAESQRGKKVGDGSCVTLAVEALRSANAKRFRLNRADGDYVWGRRVDDFKDALPGDILQFRDAEFKGKKYLTRRRWISWHESYPHHTAIVSGAGEGGKVLTILHQNVGPKGADDDQKQIVQQGTLRIDSLQKGGWVRIYRPIEPSEAETRP